MGNLGYSCLEEYIEQVLQSKSVSASSSEGTGVELLEHGGLHAVVDGLIGLTCLVSAGVVQVIGCTVCILGWDMAWKGRQVFGEGLFRDDDRCCGS